MDTSPRPTLGWARTIDALRRQPSRRLHRTLLALLALTAISGCATGRWVARVSLPIVESGMQSVNRETDTELARQALPANLKMIDALLLQDPDSGRLAVYAATGYYGYSLSFVEDEDKARAARLYQRAFNYATTALRRAGLTIDVHTSDLPQLEQALARLDRAAVPALFWTAASWGKWIELQLDDPARLAELGRVEMLMRRVLQLDDTYYYGGVHVFFMVYYGGRAPMFGGDVTRAEQHYARARALTHDRLLLLEVYRAQYLLRQQGDRDQFHATLTRVVAAPPDLFPEMALINAVAQQKARRLLTHEEDLF